MRLPATALTACASAAVVCVCSAASITASPTQASTASTPCAVSELDGSGLLVACWFLLDRLPTKHVQPPAGEEVAGKLSLRVQQLDVAVETKTKVRTPHARLMHTPQPSPCADPVAPPPPCC